MNRKNIMVISTKGGTGKSTLSCNISLELIKRGKKVGLIDADIDSSNEGEILRIMDAHINLNAERMFVPIETHGIKLFSMGLYYNSSGKAFTKTGEQNRQVIHDIIKHTEWGELDVLVCDLPAGSSDELRAVTASLGKVDGAVIVTIPTTIVDCQRALESCSRFFIPVYGIVENMAYALTECNCRPTCPKCNKEYNPFGGRDAVERIAEKHGVAFFGQIPLISDMPQRIASGNPRFPEVAIDPILRAVDKITEAR